MGSPSLGATPHTTRTYYRSRIVASAGPTFGELLLSNNDILTMSEQRETILI